MNFNQEYIKQLAEGKAILGHTKLEGDIELLNLIANRVGAQEKLGGACRYYHMNLGTYVMDWFDNIPESISHLPIIPLHDFVSPTKEEKQTIDSLDARLKELEGLVKGNGYTIAPKEGKIDEVDYIYRKAIVDLNGYKKDTIYKIKASKLMDFWAWTIPAREADYLSQKEEQPKAEWKVQDWAWSEITKTTLSLITAFEDNLALVNNQNGLIECWEILDMVKPTEQEIETYLIGLANSKYKIGTRFKSFEVAGSVRTLLPFKPQEENYVTYNIDPWGNLRVRNGVNDNIGCSNPVVWDKKQGWAEVLPQAKHEIVVALKELETGNYQLQVFSHTNPITLNEAEKYAETIKNALNG